MPSAKSGMIVCPECGEGNRATARFCTACAARLGAEPSATSRPAPVGRASSPAPLRHDGRLDAPRTTHSRPLPLGATPAADSGAFLVKFCIAGLIVMIGFIGWALYMLTAGKAVPALPMGQGSPASAEAVSAAPAALPSTAPATPAVATAPRPAPAATPPAPSLAAAPAPAGVAVATPPPAAERPPVTEGQRPVAQRRQAPRERVRPPVSNESASEGAVAGGWIEPTRPPASTSSPLYQDAGPPIVQGPGPREPAVASVPYAPPYTPPRTAGAFGRPSADPGPPIAEGPGPRYDYSTPGAVGR